MDPSVKTGGDVPTRDFADPVHSDPSVSESSAVGYKSAVHGTSSSSSAMAQPSWARGLEPTTAVETKRPLRLLDLPVDILRDIISQVGRLITSVLSGV
jgi:hypothetical protein